MVVLTGCTTTTVGEATPDTSSAAPTPSSEPDADGLPTDGAPKVDDPLDTAKFQENPCLTLTTDQSQGIFGISLTGQRYTDTLGNACKWKNEETRAQADVRFLDKNGRGLSAEYAVDEDGRWAFFEELTVEGHPAVIRGLADRRAEGICTVVVGASDEIAYEVVLRQSDAKIGTKDPCEVAADMAAETVKTINAG
jgi:hypothetical protein